MGGKNLQNIRLSILDLVPVNAGSTPGQSFKNSVDLAQKAEAFGYNRFWMSEHHNMEGVASSATVVLIGHIAGKTKSIRVGSGGIMLPNHAPLVVAEQFGTLATLYPNRIDLGLGRAPGTDQQTSRALRRSMSDSVEQFPSNVVELQNYFTNENPGSVKAVPGKGLDVPIWILGSSTYGAQLAGMLGLPYAFASHFAPAFLDTAIQVYKDHFKPSATLQKPYVMAGVNVVAADTTEEAKHLATSLYAFFLNVIRGASNPLGAPPKDLNALWNDAERAAVMQMLTYNFVGSKELVGQQLNEFVQRTQVDELMVVSNIFDHQARIRSYELLAQLQHTKIPEAQLV
ncbi:MAG: LLM class flavin-dependent oxidoreductase [Chitinophagaceae bacterium]|nr:LLM class flavin-dependent oxidoreductase [Chitinophagaceae bacterium]